jgi:toxin FitB
VTRYLLDTNVVSELRRHRPHGAVIAWVASLRPEQLCLSAVTLGELQAGIEKTRGQNPTKAREIEIWVDNLARSAQVVAMDGPCFREWARLMQGKPDTLIEDGMIAATARVHGLVVATRNERDFRRLVVEMVNPFDPKE